MKKSLCFIILGCLLMIGGIITCTIMDHKAIIEKGDCYDRNDNKINGVTCDIKAQKDSFYIGGVIVILGMFLCFGSLFFVGEDYA